MKTVVLGDPPDVLASLIAERKRLGFDRHDEVWQGEYHIAPSGTFEHGEIGATLASLLHVRARPKGLRVTLEFNLGTYDDFRVPDLGVHRGNVSGTWIATAALVVEVRSPHDETYEKFPFYASHSVDEILVVDLALREVSLFALATDPTSSASRYVEQAESALIHLSIGDVRTAIGW